MHKHDKQEAGLNCPSEGLSDFQKRPLSVAKIAVGLLVLAILIAGYWALLDSGFLSLLTNEEHLQSEVARLGFLGAFVVIALMAVAIIISPVPSGPIAIAAGAAFGPVLGAVYVVIGAALGASIAFGLARCLGYDFVCRWLGGRLHYLTAKRSQRRLMAVVFVSRLIPFISFDAVSYAAGLSPLSFWRFAMATLAGIIPISVLLTYSGERLISADSSWTTVILVGVGVVTLIPLAFQLLRRWYRKRGKHR